MNWIRCEDALPEVGRLVVTRDSRTVFDEDENPVRCYEYNAGIITLDEIPNMHPRLGMWIHYNSYFIRFENTFFEMHREWKYIEE